MNVLLIEAEEIRDRGLARIDGRKLRHLRRVLGKGVGDVVRVGEIGGRLGQGTIERIESPGEGALEDGTGAWLRYVVDQEPPPPSPVTLVLALPRPPMLRRILQHATALGIKRIVLLHAARVEKSFWDSHALQPDAIATELRLGLEQAGDTVLPTVQLRRRFRPFVEDELATWPGARLLADPSGGAVPSVVATEPVTAIVGPEGGLVPFEVERLRAVGCVCVGLGPRILRVETAVVALLARLTPS